MRITVNISLIENSATGNFQKTLNAQEIEITHENDTIMQSVDELTSKGSHPSKIIWFQSNADSLKNITNIKITQSNGNVLINGTLNFYYGMPKNIDNHVAFYVLE
ncbi:hypothetical protein [Iodobacter fluviatilis]|uniref:Uncharacterized protein n=1 Tax=Iodobacter fluviatilis TaxID=537 RepID=A0A377Q8R6_9NEIS|nr:hypothetical protein [Iodobacter fluviatilis]TCU82441.1 hypothetical protein EV682_11580 [Iodobacter fluviatilis]STQ91666.1 Uncharacterised protein [Iodobacter fluviatilis]